MAKSIGVCAETLLKWELNKTKPEVRHYPDIMNFLTYCPYQVVKTFGQKLKLHRTHRGYTVKTLAKLIGVDERTVARKELVLSHPSPGNHPQLKDIMNYLSPQIFEK